MEELKQNKSACKQNKILTKCEKVSKIWRTNDRVDYSAHNSKSEIKVEHVTKLSKPKVKKEVVHNKIGKSECVSKVEKLNIRPEISSSTLQLKQIYRCQTGKSTVKRTECSSSNDHLSVDYCMNSKMISGLNKLIMKSSNEILFTILDKTSGILSLINSGAIKNDVLPYILIALGKACLCELRKDVNIMISSVSCNILAISVNIQRYLVSFQKQNTIKKVNVDSVYQLVIFLQKFQSISPSSASESISILLPLLSSTCIKYIKDEKFCSDINEKLKEIEEQNQVFINHYDVSQMKKENEKEKLLLQEPPENFRVLSVLPTVDDIKLPCLFLRPNKTKGNYDNTDHYLDVQFRLLKEDYVKPLRDGIAEYIRLKTYKTSHFNCQDVRVYKNVKVVKEEFMNGDLFHLLLFPSNNFSKINWEHNKRFLTGSLLCLSSDDFETMLFASVTNRDTKYLRKSLLYVKFFETIDETLKLNPSTNFVVIETTAYFEAYCHNLTALLQLHEQNLPLKRYIIDVEKIVHKPEYLTCNTTYDMRPLFIALDERYVKMYRRHKTAYIFPLDVDPIAQMIPVLSDCDWPTASDLNLDISQYLALKTAITKEFAIIQGPPGTGKTYIGLRIVQLLLHNIDNWFCDVTNSLPVLIVCYTNHALDQFLEGLLSFTKNIARIGGRVSSESISDYRLNSLKKEAIFRGEIPYDEDKRYIKYEIRELKRRIDEIKQYIENNTQTVYSEYMLSKYIPPAHYQSLNDFNDRYKGKRGFIIYKWLGIDFSSEVFNKNTPISNLTKDVEQISHVSANEVYENIESEDEDDIEFIESQRNIDNDDLSSEDEIFEFEGSVISDISNSNESMNYDEDWQLYCNKRDQTKYISNKLQNSEAMQADIAVKIRNVWNLDLDKRWQLYKFWVQEFINQIKNKYLRLQQKLKDLLKILKKKHAQDDFYILNKCHVVGMTTTGAAKYRSLVQKLNPAILIIEEAAEILESHVVTSLAPNTQHIVLIGDQQQLQPSPTVHMLAVKYDLNISLFERMIKNGIEFCKLSIQHRMRPEIAALIVPHIYPNLENHKLTENFENIKGVNKNVFFVSHKFNEQQEHDSKSKVNYHEAKFLIKLCRYLILQGYDPSQITILTTYTGQLFILKKFATGLVRKVRITVVDNFQGEENDIILISFVRSNKEGEIGFLKVPNRVCVALSRARKGLFCIGNFELLAKKSDLWKNIVKTLYQKDCIGPSLKLMCQNHPDTFNEVSVEKDFEAVSDGGCMRVCNYRLTCGHPCPLLCHPYNHDTVCCEKLCIKTCINGHQCSKKCFQKCGPCKTLIDRKLNKCQHTVKARCGQEENEITCTYVCEKVLDCRHACLNLCSDQCICREKVKFLSPVCGHTLYLECSFTKCIDEILKKCSEPCQKILPCNHICTGTCSTCYQGRLHVPCKEDCEQILICGHKCESYCSNSCPPCQKPCENRCSHSKCLNRCSEPCKICKSPCEWICVHKKCMRMCHEECNREPCNEPCPNLLPCSHPCIGFCGEPCPTDCLICKNKTAKLRETHLLSKNKEHFTNSSSKYVCLEDCNHIFEVNYLNDWLTTNPVVENEIRLKKCPECTTVIRKNVRFQKIIKKSLAEIEKIKKISKWNKERNSKVQKFLLKRMKMHGLKGKLNCEPLFICLQSQKIRNIQELTTMENIINIAIDFKTVYIDGIFSKNISVLTEEQLKYVRSSGILLSDLIEHQFLNATEQQLLQAVAEMYRLKLINKFLSYTGQKTLLLNSDFKDFACLFSYTPFSIQNMMTDTAFQNLICILDSKFKSKEQVFKSVNMAVGHWYRCSNSHLYCITMCGNTVEKHNCYICKNSSRRKNVHFRFFHQPAPSTFTFSSHSRVSQTTIVPALKK